MCNSKYKWYVIFYRNITDCFKQNLDVDWMSKISILSMYIQVDI